MVQLNKEFKNLSVSAVLRRQKVQKKKNPREKNVAADPDINKMNSECCQTSCPEEHLFDTFWTKTIKCEHISQHKRF